MKFLFPHRYRLIGWILAIPSAVITVLAWRFEIVFPFLHYSSGWNPHLWDEGFLFALTDHNFTGDLGAILSTLGLLMIAFSKERQEDERTLKLRLESLLWAVYVNTALILLTIVFFYGLTFLMYMVFNICSTLVLFIGRYSWVMYAERRQLKQETV